MKVDSLSKVVMVRSCEEEDPKGYFLSLHDRQRASLRASEAPTLDDNKQGINSMEELLIIDRAERLTEKLERRYAVLLTARRLTLIQIPLFLIIVLAILGGLLTDPIGPRGQINLLHFPLLVLVIWNGAMYIWSTMRYVLKNAWKSHRAECISDWLNRTGLWVLQVKLRLFQQASQEEKQWIVASLSRFFQLWSSLVGEGVRLKGKSMLHWGAAGLAIGVIIGLYCRGFVFEYRASWASTFLEAEQVHHMLAVILFPASTLLGIDFPSVQAIATLKAPGSENAAIWIHLWAVTCLILIVLPRVGLALITSQNALKQLDSLTLPLEQPYFHRLLTQYRGEDIWVEVLPYQCQLKHSLLELLEEFSLEMFGNRAYVQTRKPISYGESNFRMKASGTMPLRVLIVFDVATTPEQEVHGAFLQNIQDQVESWNGDASLLILLHEGSYRKRADPERLRERFQTWERFMSGHGLKSLVFSNSADVNNMIQQATTKLWSGRSQEVL